MSFWHFNFFRSHMFECWNIFCFWSTAGNILRRERIYLQKNKSSIFKHNVKVFRDRPFVNSIAKRLHRRYLIGFWTHLLYCLILSKSYYCFPQCSNQHITVRKLWILLANLWIKFPLMWQIWKKINVLKPAFVSVICAGITCMSPLPCLYLQH